MYEQELRRIEIFRDLADDEFHQVAACLEELNLPANHVVFRQGDEADAFFVIRTGTVVVFRDGGKDEPVQLLARLGAGDHFGEFGTCEGRRQAAAARTCEPTQILRLHREALHSLLPHCPTLALGLQLARRQGAVPGFARRREVRTVVDKPVAVMLEDGTSVITRLVDLSRGGLSLAGSPPSWQVGQWVKFHLNLGPGMLQLGGRVRWIREDDDSVGVTFMQRSQGHNMKIQWALRQLVGTTTRGEASAPRVRFDPQPYRYAYA